MAQTFNWDDNFILFSLGSKQYFAGASTVKELLDAVKVTPVKGFNDVLMGVCNWKGYILPVYSLATILGEPESDEQGQVLVLRTEPPLGIKVSAGLGIAMLDPAHLVKEVPMLNKMIVGLYRTGDKEFSYVVDLTKLTEVNINL